MGNFNQVYSNFSVIASMSTYCKNANGVIDHVNTSRSPGSVTKTFSTSGIPSNAIIDSVNFSVDKTVSGSVMGNSIEYIAEDGTDTIRANNETILNWLNNNRGTDNEYPNITINCWANTTGYPDHAHSNIINTSKLVTGQRKATYNEISLTVSYHLDMDLEENSPDIASFQIYDNFKTGNYSAICQSRLVSGGTGVLNSTSVSLSNNCIFQGYSSLNFYGSATSNQDNDTTVSYNLIIKKEDGTIIYNEIQNHGYFSLSSNIFSGITATRQINGADFKAAKIIFYYKVKDVTNRETQATGSIFLIDGYSSPKINNFTVSKEVSENSTYAKGSFDATFSEIPYSCSEANGTINVEEKNSLTYQKILKNNDTDESSSSSNYPYTGSVTDSYFVDGNNKISLDDNGNYTLTIKVTDICNSITSFFNLKPETVFLDIETTGVSIGRQILNKKESLPKFEVHLPTYFYSSSSYATSFYGGIHVTADLDPAATNLVDCPSEFWGNVRISDTLGNNTWFSVSVPSTFYNKVTFNGGVDFGESASFDFSQRIMAVGGITVGNASNPSEAIFNGSATFNNETTFNDKVIFNSSLEFDSASFSSASINSKGSLTIASDASLYAYGSSIFTQNINANGGITVGSSTATNPSGATFNGAAIFKKGVTFEDVVTFSKNISANGGITVGDANAETPSGATFNGTAIFNNFSIFYQSIIANGGITVGSSSATNPSGATFNGTATFNNRVNLNEKIILKENYNYGYSTPSTTINGHLFFKIID